MLKKVIKWSVVLTVIMTVLYFGTGQHISDETPDCELLKPLPAETLAHFRELVFSDKTRLSPNKFGFRKKLVIKEGIMLSCQEQQMKLGDLASMKWHSASGK